MSETASSYSSLFSDIQALDGTLTSPGNYTITLGANITAGGDLEAISLASGVNLTINGAGFTYSGGGDYEGLFVYQGDVTVENLTIADAKAQGGAGGSGGGGGGAGLGGGLFVAGTTGGAGSIGGNVTLSGVTFSDDSAIGGAGGAGKAGGAGGGGGLGGAGASGNAAEPGGGGGIGATATGSSNASAGGTGIIPGAGGGGASGVGGGIAASGGRGGYGGGGGGSDSIHKGSGGFGGGGGADALGVTTGGFGGTGGYGGFGGGGGAGAGSYGSGGFGGGNGGVGAGASGGGGLGAGGDIFVQAGGHLTIESGTLNAGTVQGGGGANDGEALGSALFLANGGSITLSQAVATTLTITGAIDGNSILVSDGTGNTLQNAALVLNGEGAVLLAGSAGAGAGTFATTIDSGTLILGTAGAAGTKDISFNGTGTLALSSAAIPSNTLDGFTFGDVIDITNFASTGDINANGSGVLSLDSGAITLNFGAVGADEAFALNSDNKGGTDIELAQKTAFDLLNGSIQAANALQSGAYTITLTGDVAETGALTAVSLATGVTLVIDGDGYTLSGTDAYQGLAVDQGSVAVQNLTIANAVAQGAGGGISIGTGGSVAVTLSNVSFADDTATGSTAYGGDIYVAAGQSITIDGGTLGLGTVTGGQDLGSDLYLAAGASATLTAPSGTTLAVDGSIFEAGSATLVLNGPGTVDLVTANTLSSSVQLDDGTLLLGAAGAGSVSFATGSSATLATAGTIGDHAAISGFGFGDEIDITGLSLSGSTFESLNGPDQLVVSDSSLAVTLTFAPSLSNEIFAIESDGHGGTRILLSTLAASSFAQLNTAIKDIDAAKAGDYTIDLSGGITNLADLTAISLAAGVSLTIDGLGHTLSGGGTYAGLFVYQGDVTLENLTIANAVAQGGAGGYGGGGGGAGLGGGLFIAGSGTATTGGDVTLSSVNFINDSAIGGAGGQLNPVVHNTGGDGGGGGGLGGAGGSDNGLQGGGGGVGNQAAGGAGADGAAGIIPGASGGSAYGGIAGGASGGGGGGAANAGGGGVGGGDASHFSTGGAGGFGGGGGGGVSGGGGGGFGGGGGGADGGGYDRAAGGAGGFGGGGGGADGFGAGSPSGAGGFGAGAGSNGSGGGGLGAGGDIFVQAGASLTIESGTLGAGTVAGGTGGVAGDAFGTALFLQGTGAETLSPAAGTTLTIAGSIADQTGSLPTASSHGAGGMVINGTGTVLLTAASDYTGGTTIDSGTLILGAPDAAGEGNIVFGSGDPPVLAFTIADAPTNTIASFGHGDTIDITNLLASRITGESFNASTNVLGITYTGESAPLDLTFANNLHTGFIFSSDGAGGTDIVPCFASGTRILGLHGDILVEDIAVGDELVMVRDGGPVTQKVVWTGRRAIDIRRHPRPELVRPIRIIAGAIAPGVPERDLRLSPEHAVYLDGKLFTAASLVNGTTIYQEQNTTHVTYHHIELASHNILMAEGLPCESYLDTGSKTMFENVSGITVLHPDFCHGPGAEFCAPLVREGQELEAIRARLNGRATQAA